MRGNSVRVVLSPSVMGAATRGLARALGEKEVSNSENLKDTLTIDTTILYPGEVQSTDQQVVTFVDDEEGDERSYSNVSQNLDTYKIDSTLASFLSRPVLINSYTWTEGSPLNKTFYPWNEFLGNSVIKKKVENYNFISATMKVKFLINASPFYYGCAGAFYEPMSVFNPAPYIETAGYDGYKVPLSQRPHVWLYPANSQGGVLELPFIYHKNWLDITSASDTISMGQIRLTSFVNLLNANSVSGSDCDIQVYAWMEDVKMCGPTYSAALQSTDMKISPEHVEGEYDDSAPISSVASSISRMAEIGSKLPGPIGVGMGAASTIAGYVADVARIFGYTNTPVVDDVTAFKNLPFHAFSSAEISTPIDRLTLDPKNILGNNDGHFGVKLGDELDIAAFCARESYLTAFTWEAADTLNSLLWGVAVNPRMLRVDGSSAFKYQLTPMALPGYLFRYWRGNIVYRFRFICTKYHRGRVRITWDPSANLAGVVDTNTSNYNRIVDLSKETDVSIKVPYLASTSYLRSDDGASEYFGTTPPAPGSGFDNGQLTIRVMNQQTSPVTSADVICLVSCYGLNMEFGGPTEMSADFSAYTLQSEDQMIKEGSKPEDLFENTETPSDINQIYMGENITSFAQLMKRTTYHASTFFNTSTNAGIAIARSRFNRYPRYPGFDTSALYEGQGVLTPVAYFGYNFVNWTPLTFVSQCYVGCRGSINWHFNVCHVKPVSSVRAKRYDKEITASELSDEFLLSSGLTQSERASFCDTNMSVGATGQSLTNQHTQSAMSVNVPMYTNFKFRKTSSDGATLGSQADKSVLDNVEVEFVYTPEADHILSDIRLDSYVASGPDYQVGFFLNVPTLYQLTAVPAGNPVP